MSTLWFMVCVGYVLAMALHQAGFRWWVIFSFSGHSALFIFLLISLYLFTMFGAAGKGQETGVEHPLTGTGPYLTFYVSAPLFGALAGAAAMSGETRITQFLSGVALGTLGTTALMWVIVDPLTSVLETLTPAARKHRGRRLAAARAERKKREHDREELLARVSAQQEEDRHRWQALMMGEAEKLAALLKANRADFEQAERQAVDMGVRAWRIGGLNCMRQLRDMAVDLYKDKYKNLMVVDYISVWWDGIGSWRSRTVG